MKRHHPMPFGAQFDARGAVHFRLWAPGASAVGLDLAHERGKINIPMPPAGDGWYALAVDAIPAGVSDDEHLTYRDDRKEACERRHGDMATSAPSRSVPGASQAHSRMSRPIAIRMEPNSPVTDKLRISGGMSKFC